LTKNKPESTNSALVVGTVLILVGAWNLYRHRVSFATGLLVAGACLLLIWLTAPGLSRGFHRLWMGFAGALGYVNSRILLSLMFFLVITPYGLIMRLAGRDRLRRRTPHANTYWIRRPVSRQSTAMFERMF